MGNSAIIAVRKAKTAPALYLHWNGGPESVMAFCHAARELGVRPPYKDDYSYFLARLSQIVGNFFGGTTSVGITQVGRGDDSDNGTYFIGHDFEILSRTQEGPMRVEDLSEGDREKYESIRNDIIKYQGPAFEEYSRDQIVITREAKE